MLQTDSTWVRQ